MTQDILECIHNKMNTFSKGQRRIAAYILESYDKAAFLTASVLGKTAQVSESTVVRFASQLGYDGYPEMQKALQELVLHRLTAAQRMEASETRIAQEDVISTVLLADAERIHKTAEQLDTAQFQAAVETLLSSKRVFVLGVRSSASLASFLCYYLRYLFDDVRQLMLSSESETFEALVRITPQDVLLGISFPRYCSATVRAMELAHSRGAKTIALTDCASSPIAQNADCLLLAGSGMVSLVDSMVAPMSVINALLVAVAARRKSEATQTLQKFEEIWDCYHVYEKNGE
ncbi:MAG: MurR/RpiR family transcriptional regulator [Faecousia sp.]